MDIKAISFDLDGTLVYMSISIEQYLSNIYEKLGFHFGLEQVSAVYKEVHRWWKERFLSGQPRTHEAWIEYNCRLFEGLGAKGDLQRLSERVLARARDPESGNEKLYPEVKGVLRELREKEISLAIVSHRPLPFSLRSLRRHGIEEYFQCMVSPEIAKAPKGKLSPEMWQFALRKLGFAPAEILHVDDNHEWISGAKQAGIQPVLIDRKGIQSSTFDCVVIHDLTEIFELL